MKPTLETPISEVAWARVVTGLVLTLSLALTACGGGGGGGSDAPSGGSAGLSGGLPTAADIAAAQAALDGNTMDMSSPPTEQQMAAAQAVLDGATSGDSLQTALDASAPVPAFAGL
jgi:hypothetical protein